MVAVIIPALNEEKTIKDVLEVTKTSKLVNRIIVVSDGSVDNTASIARSCGVEVIELEKNIGKGGAMCVGVKSCSEDIVLFLDADLIGLTELHIDSILKPVVNNEVEMSIGIFSCGRIITDLAQLFTPFLSGQRAIKRNLFEKVIDLDITKFGVEIALTQYADKHKIAYRKVKLYNITHLTKEEKLGFNKGLKSRLNMYIDIIKNFKLFNK